MAKKVKLNVEKDKKTEEDPEWTTKMNKKESLAKVKLQRDILWSIVKKTLTGWNVILTSEKHL